MPVFALDIRGHGASSDAPSHAYSQADFAADVAADVVAFMDALKVGRATVVGHSMGGLIAHKVAVEYPGRVMNARISKSSLSGLPMGGFARVLCLLVVFAAGCDLDFGSCNVDYVEHSLELWSVEPADGQRTLIYDGWPTRVLGSSLASDYRLVAAAPGAARLYYALRFVPEAGLYNLDPGTGTVTRVLPLEAAADYSFSPDGTRIAYVPGTNTNELWIANADGTGNRILVRDTLSIGHPIWLADNRRVAYMRLTLLLSERDRGGVWVVDTADSSSVRRSHASTLPFSITADGEAVVYAYDTATEVTEDAFAVFLEAASHPAPIRLADGYNPRFSPDGRGILYVHPLAYPEAELWIMSRDGADRRRVAGPLQHLGDVAFSSDGSHLLFLAEGSLWTVPIDGRGLRRLVHPDDHVPALGNWESISPTLASPLLAADGSRTYYLVGKRFWDDGC